MNPSLIYDWTTMNGSKLFWSLTSSLLLYIITTFATRQRINWLQQTTRNKQRSNNTLNNYDNNKTSEVLKGANV